MLTLKNRLFVLLLLLPAIAFSQIDTLKTLKDDVDLEEVVVVSTNKDQNITGAAMGVEWLTISQIKRLPVFMGEVDVLKAIQLLPGIQATAEGSTGFSVRGGSPDQNLIVLDKTTIYNPSHLMGFFSAFNNDIVKDIELYKGDFPFRHGGRLSSLLEVNTKTDFPKRFSGSGGVGLIASRLMLEGNIGENTSWLLAGRRSYADVFLFLSSNESMKDASLYFYDLNAKLSHRLGKNDKLELNLYNGKDNFGAGKVGRFKYGNSAASLTWNHIFSSRLFADFSVNFSDYNYGLGSDLDNMKVDWTSGIRDWMIRADFRNPISPLWSLAYGLNATFHSFNPGWVQMEGLNTYEVPGDDIMEYVGYISNDQKLSEVLTLRYGLRFSIFHNLDDKKSYSAVEPGIGAVFRLNEYSSIKANYSHNTQYLQLANNSAAGSPLDIWFPASEKIKPQKVNMYSLGYFRNFKNNMFEASVEAYYKDLRNVIDFREHSSLMLNANLEDEVRTGKGKAYGIEFMLRKNEGSLTGFVNYTLSRSERTIPEVNGGKSYLAPYDKTHVFNIVGNYVINKKVNVSATWVFATGNPTTYPTGRFEIMGEYYPIYSGRNEYRRPNYDRLDLSVNFIPKPDSKKRWKGEWNFSVYNAYNKKNAWTISYNQDKDTGRPYAEMMYLFGIIPSITYNFKF